MFTIIIIVFLLFIGCYLVGWAEEIKWKQFTKASDLNFEEVSLDVRKYSERLYKLFEPKGYYSFLKCDPINRTFKIAQKISRDLFNKYNLEYSQEDVNNLALAIVIPEEILRRKTEGKLKTKNRLNELAKYFDVHELILLHRFNQIREKDNLEKIKLENLRG